MQHLYEVVLGMDLDKRNFRKKIQKMNLLVELEEWQAGVPHRAARLYRFDRQRYEELKSHGFNFEV